MHTPRRIRPSPLFTVVLATVPLLLAAVTVWMVRDALAHSDPPTASASLTPTSPGTQ